MLDNSTKNFIDLVRTRTSCRSYLEKDVPDEAIEQCVEAARLAPSACNKQPCRFIIVKDAELRKRICAEALLPGLPMPWLRQAPVIVALCAEKSVITHTIAPFISGIQYQLIDVGIAGEHFVLQAQELGLGTCWIGWFKAGKARKILTIPGSFQIISLMSLGYPAEEPHFSERLPLEKIMFRDNQMK
ncbi:MAG: hypothetical protein A2020_06930 [Lentisphaerae bacterium GWF2_45_14]|nr:MAG: hypothetical protein A2020_06930 [Lentisphaerae bacterium GWF2_45_14]